MILQEELKNKKSYEVFQPTGHDDLILYNGHDREEAFKIAKNQKYTTWIEVFEYKLEHYPDFDRYESGNRTEYYEVTNGKVTKIE